MNIKHLCLIAALLGLPVDTCAAGTMRISYRIDITNFPAGNRLVVVHCAVGVGSPSALALASWEPATLISQGAQTFEVPTSSYAPDGRTLHSNAVMPLTAIPTSLLDQATHYKCRLSGAAGEPVFMGPEVSGVIRR